MPWEVMPPLEPQATDTQQACGRRGFASTPPSTQVSIKLHKDVDSQSRAHMSRTVCDAPLGEEYMATDTKHSALTNRSNRFHHSRQNRCSEHATMTDAC